MFITILLQGKNEMLESLIVLLKTKIDLNKLFPTKYI